MTGRPSLYTAEISEEICDRLAAGESLNAICRDERMPSRKVVHEWVADDRDGFRDKYARAREAQIEHYADEIIELADAVAGETQPAIVQAAKLRIDTRKWVASKLLPRKYGERVDMNHTAQVNAITRIELVAVEPPLRE